MAKKKEYINLSKEAPKYAEKISFWAFTGKWAVLFAIVGIIALINKQYLAGIIIIIICVGYITFRLKRMKKKYKKS